MIMPINSQSRETRETRDFQGFACKNTQLSRDRIMKSCYCTGALYFETFYDDI